MSNVEVVTNLNRGLLMAESAALKAKLSDVRVANPKAEGGFSRAHTYFTFPHEQRKRRYPMITIEFIGMEFANDRAESAQLVPINYWPSEFATFAEYAEAYGIEDFVYREGGVEAVIWHPYNLLYQITTYARDPVHDMALTRTLAGTAFIPASGWGYLEIPEDGSCRWLDRLSFQVANYLEGDPQDAAMVFRKIYTVNVSAHIPPENPFIYSQVLAVAGTVLDKDSEEQVATWAHTAP